MWLAKKSNLSLDVDDFRDATSFYEEEQAASFDEEVTDGEFVEAMGQACDRVCS